MSKVIARMTMSLDGFVTGPNVSETHPMGEGGEGLHDWQFESPSDIDKEIAQTAFATTGAVVLGKRTFDLGLKNWEDTPFPVPSFVVTHEPREQLLMRSATFAFVADGIESAVNQAKAAASERDVLLMGASMIQQSLQAGLADEIQINLVPILFGEGTRLFEHFGEDRIELEKTQVLDSPAATHLYYRVVK